MIQSPFLRRIVIISLAVLPELYSFVECVIGLLALTFILSWMGLADGTFARVVSTIWLIISALRWTARRRHVNNRKNAAPSAPLAVPMLVAHQLSQVSVPLEGEGPTGANRREQAIQRVMEKQGLSREEVESQLRKYGL
ncbi:hypothetical protein [Hymenobacter sp. BT523]|uniref:hypothetical protein n=1 Tax=Hymenobacter sp. BT523 TaxID=2795725 RepID=UPI0018EB563F|nr:hypothetical protein [Hymenobacter sp. BT523]